MPYLPAMITLPDNFALIYPTDALLNPEKIHNFVSMHYLFKTIEEVKFVFVFNHSDVSDYNHLKNVK